MIPATNIRMRCQNLRSYWWKRNTKFKEWYKVIKLDDQMLEEGKESYVSNSPRTFFNLAKHLITPDYIPHKFIREGLDAAQMENTVLFENGIRRGAWDKLDKQYRKLGRRGAIDLLASYILATGWYAVRVDLNDRGFVADIWHPAKVFPAFSMDDEVGLAEVAYIYTIPKHAAYRKAQINGWSLGYVPTDKLEVIEYYWITEEGDVAHAVISGNHYLKEPEILPSFQQIGIPVIIGPVGGLPDDGELDTNWQENYGESIVAVNEGIYKNSDRLASFLQQMVKEAAEPKWLELTSGTPIVTPERFKSGAIFRGQQGDSVSAIQSPPVPVELQQRIFQYEQKMQEGSFSPLMLGNLQFQVSAYVMSQVAQAAEQVLSPYHEAMMHVLSEVDNLWIKMMQEWDIAPNGLTLPSNLRNVEMECNYNISIPGDLINRITVAKMMNPELRFSPEYIFQNMFPEVMDIQTEMAKSRKDIALNSEIGITVTTILAYRAMAADAMRRKDAATAELYMLAEKTLMSKLSPEMQASVGGGQGKIPVQMQNVMPEGQ